METNYILEKISQLSHVDIFEVGEGELNCIHGHPRYNPISENLKLRERLMAGAEGQSLPYLYRDDYRVYFICIKVDKFYYMAGPMLTEAMGQAKIFKFYRSYGMNIPREIGLKSYRVSEVLELTQTMAALLLDQTFESEELMLHNHITEDTRAQEEREKIVFEIEESEEEMYHHSYMEERNLLDCVREGRVEDAIRHNQDMDVDLGRLSKKELNHWHNVAIVGITLCTRAAIEGGVTPAAAYRTSDFYIQKCDDCNEVEQLMAFRNHAVEDLTRQVYEKHSKKKISNYVDRCKDYVNKNYRKKIYVEDIAEALGVSKGHLSRLFKAEEQMTIMDYVTKTRLTHAANLLIYSQESIAAIAEYVNFPSQSYMGRVFKQYKGITPAQYREKYKPREFSS